MVRVICPYIDDIYTVADALLKQDDITYVEKKDYIKKPKPNGYRSLHLIVKVPVFFADGRRDMTVEVQIRTIAMDFWASLEHQLHYKDNEMVPESIVRRLRDCADSIDEVKAIAKLGPNILVAEPTELIGTGKPADKEYVDEVIRVIRDINPDIKPFPSAGISKGEDCYNIIKAGSSASGCSSAIAKAKDPLALAEEMISAVRRAWDELHA